MDDSSSTPPPQLPPSETQNRRSMGGSSTSTPPQLPPNLNDLQQEVKSMQGYPLGSNPELVSNYWSRRLERVTTGKPVGLHPRGNRPSIVRATSISIGPDFRKESIRAHDLTLKLSFAKKKLVWEFIEGPSLKEKIVVPWSDITAIHAHIPDHQPGLLQIQFGSTPLFFRKTPPERKWIKTSDFTHANSASRHRIHEAKFRQGVLAEHYAKLMLCNQRLLKLSMHPFPAYPSPTQQGESSSTAACLQQQSLTTTVNNPTPSTAMEGESSSSRNAQPQPLVLPSYQNEPLAEELYHDFFNLVNPAPNVDQLTMDTSAHDHPINSLPNTLEGSNIDAGDQQSG